MTDEIKGLLNGAIYECRQTTLSIEYLMSYLEALKKRMDENEKTDECNNR